MKPKREQLRRFVPALVAAASVVLAVHPQVAAASDDGSLAYWSFNLGTLSSIHPDGNDNAQLTSIQLGVANEWPEYSPDGSQIAYVRQTSTAQLKIMDADGSNPVTVVAASTLGPSWSYMASPTWSPSGDHLAFCARKGSSGHPVYQIFTIAADGSGLRNISGSNTADCNPSWAPSGSKIAFAIEKNGGSANALATMSPTGKSRTVLASNGSNDYPAWSPDSSKILFSRLHNDRYDLAVISCGGGSITYVTNTKRWEWTPAWSPDGSKIVYARTSTSSFASTDDLWVANADGSGATQITNTPLIDEWAPTWGSG